MTDGDAGEHDRTVPADLAAGAGSESTRSRGLGAIRDGLARGGSLFIQLFDRRSTANRRLTIGVGLVVGAACLLGIPEQIAAFYAGNDIELPLRAAARWAAGGEAYPASAILIAKGPDLPYLYPPFLLPLLAPIAALPRDVVTAAWLILCAACAVWTCRWLAMPWRVIPFVLAWPPFAEGLIVGNVQIICFAAFVALVYERGDTSLRPRSFDRARDAANGLLAAVVGVFKFTQVLPGLYLARRRLRAAVIGAAAVLLVAAVMLPLTGVAIYGDWLAQLARAGDPSWVAAGVAPNRIFGIPNTLLLAVGAVIALAARGRDAVAWLGIALIVATPSAHAYTFLFLLPGLMTIRRDMAILLATLFLGVYHGIAWWTASALVAYLLLAGRRWSWLRAPELNSGDPGAGPPALDRVPGVPS